MLKASGLMKLLPFKRRKKNLLSLCEYGDLEGVRQLLEGDQQVDINMQDREHKNWTPLHYACKFGHFEIAQLLVKKGANIEMKASNGWTPLPIACHGNFVRIANMLLKNGADVNATVEKDFSPIMLVTCNTEDDVEPLIRSLLKHGASLEIANARGWTPLVAACDMGRENLVRLFLEHEADPNRQDNVGWTALMAAAKHNEGAIAKLLIESGAKLEMAITKLGKNKIEDHALHVASYMNSPDVVKELIDHGADVNRTNADGLSPLMIATNERKPKVVEALLKSETIDVNLPHKDTGLPALFVAAQKGYREIFERLLQHGAQDEVNGINVMEVARLFKGKDQISKMSKKQYWLSQRAEPPTRVKPPEREFVAAEAVTEGTTLVPEHMLDVTSTTTSLETSDTSSLYDEGEDTDSPPEQKTVAEQDKPRGLLKPQPSLSREEYLKQLLKISDMIYKTSQARMLSFNEFSGKGVKNPNIYQLQKPASIIEKRRIEQKLACEKAISNESNVKLRVIKFNHAGIPRSGKTTFLRRFKGEIENIVKARQRGEGEQPSTGVAEDGGQVLVRSTSSAGVKSTVWSVLKEKGDEADMLNQLFYQLIYNDPSTTIEFPLHTSASPQASPSSGDRSSSISTSIPMAPSANSSMPDTDIVTDRSVDTSSVADEMLSIIEETLESKNWAEIKHVFEDLTWLVNTDTGGHSEFLDLQAALIQGPSFNFLYLNLENDLDKQFPVYFTDKEGRSTEEVSSTSTTEEVIFQFLASSACFNSAGEKYSDLNTGYSTSRTMIVGTHRDRVSEEAFRAKDKLLRQMIESTDFYDKGMIVFASEDQLMLSVDNMKGNEDEIKGIQIILEKTIVNHFKPISIPASWLVLSLYLRRKNFRAISLKKCEEIGRKLKITPDNLQHALWFLHHCVGLLLYYPEVEALRDIVICSPQLVHDSTSNLITNASSFEKVGHKACKEFKEQAHFHVHDFQKAMEKSCNSKTDLLSPDNLVTLLEHINILCTPFADKNIFFMPSLLRNARASELTIPLSDKSNPAPLILRYNCGYIPLGLFPSVIASLLSQQPKGWKFIEKGLCKNRIQFRVGKDFDLVTLNSYPQYLEIAISQSEDVETPVKSLCFHVRSVVQSTLLSVTSHMNDNFNMGYKFGFRCPGHPDEKHLCLLDHDASDEAANRSARKMLCHADPRDPVPFSLDHKHKVWFVECTSLQTEASLRENSGSDSGHRYSHQLDLDYPHSIAAVPLTHLAVKKYLKSLTNDDILSVGLELGLQYTHLKNIKSSSDFLDEVVHRWLRQDDDVNKTSGTPSWDSLAKALERANFTGVASRIREGTL